MERIGIAPTARLSLWLGGALGLLMVATNHAPWAAGILAGTGWGVLNLRLWARLMATVFTVGARAPGRMAAAAFLKFPVLYGGGYLLLAHGRGVLDPAGVLIGLSLPLGALVFKAPALSPVQAPAVRSGAERTGG